MGEPEKYKYSSFFFFQSIPIINWRFQSSSSSSSFDSYINPYSLFLIPIHYYFLLLKLFSFSFFFQIYSLSKSGQTKPTKQLLKRCLTQFTTLESLEEETLLPFNSLMLGLSSHGRFMKLLYLLKIRKSCILDNCLVLKTNMLENLFNHKLLSTMFLLKLVSFSSFFIPHFFHIYCFILLLLLLWFLIYICSFINNYNHNIIFLSILFIICHWLNFLIYFFFFY